MLNLFRRFPLQDLQFLIAAILVQKETGGNLAELLDKTAAVLRSRIQLQQKVKGVHRAGPHDRGYTRFAAVRLLHPLESRQARLHRPIVRNGGWPKNGLCYIGEYDRWRHGYKTNYSDQVLIRSSTNMEVTLIAVFAALAIFAAIGLVLLLVVSERSPTEVRLAGLRSRYVDSAEAGEASDGRGIQNTFSLLTQPLAPFRDWLRSHDQELSYRLGLAGYRKPEDTETYLSVKLLAPVVGILLATFAPPENILLYGSVLGAGAFFVPDMFLFYKISKRKNKIGQALPDALDLLVICMEAGLGIDQAVIRIAKEIEPVHPELSEELSIIGYEQRAGKPRLDAWRSMADRVDLDTVNQFVAMLVQTERLGTPIAKALGTFADGLRTKRLMHGGRTGS